ncbi:hypothetical protein ACFTWF_37380 [Rhodococcus sp. NPDC056960]|uniref:hypothetical protein n=1 Tax=Rhodococcus sp. NPDC056960 TaxID=3345982 RepID=UPI00363E637D
MNPTATFVDGYLGQLIPYIEPEFRRYLDAASALPSLSSAQVEFSNYDDTTNLAGMLLAGRDTVISHPAAVLP